jgi:hypothetical protein
MTTPNAFIRRLKGLKDGDAAYITIIRKDGKLYYNDEVIEEVSCGFCEWLE